jgi:phosphoribosylformylglycinamidine cyclo-ligase
VDIDAGNSLIKAIKPLAKSTKRLGAVGNLGGFGGLFDLKATGYKDPILISATDGVGTKLKIAQELGVHNTIGIDLVAMCVNDIVVQGGEPLFFLDYFATSKLEIPIAKEVVRGIAEGCLQSGSALIGGETAEMPGMYSPGEYDLAGFSVGAVERVGLLPRNNIAINDVVLGLASNGLHSNGFSLVRKVIKNTSLRLNEPAPFNPTKSIGSELLEPTRIYVKSCMAAIKAGGVKALAHITGGGLIENIPRVLPQDFGVDLYCGSWDLPAIFLWLADKGGIVPMELARTFNCGIGMVIIVAPDQSENLQQILRDNGEIASPIGKVVERSTKERINIFDIENSWKAI